MKFYTGSITGNNHNQSELYFFQSPTTHIVWVMVEGDGEDFIHPGKPITVPKIKANIRRRYIGVGTRGGDLGVRQVFVDKVEDMEIEKVPFQSYSRLPIR